MTDETTPILKHFAAELIVALERRLERNGVGPTTRYEVAGALKDLAQSPEFYKLLNEARVRLERQVALAQARQRRHDPFLRLMLHPLSDAFEKGTLHREIVPNLISFLHLVMGDEMTVFAQRVRDISGDHFSATDFDWDAFYDDPRAKVVLWTVFQRIAQTFRRFEIRRDWFLTLMQHHPQAVSLASNFFVPLSHEEESNRPFGIKEFKALFFFWFDPLRHLNGADRAIFTKAFATTPEAVFGLLWANLDGMGAWAGQS